MARTNLVHWSHGDVSAAWLRPMRADPPRGKNASGTSASADVPPDRLQSPPRRRAIAVAAESIGTPCRPCCWSHGRGARRRGAAGWCARWGSAPLALARTRRWAAAAQITPLSITVRAAPCLHARARGAALRLPRRRFTGCPRPPPYPPPPSPSPPVCLARLAVRHVTGPHPLTAPPATAATRPSPPHPNAAPLWPTL